MLTKSAFLIITLLLAGTLTLAFKIQSVKASGTIYIRADGSIDPPTAPISTVDYVTYTFTGDINDSIVVEKNDSIIDGAGYRLETPIVGSGTGLDLTGRSNITIKNITITRFYFGMYLNSSLGNCISGNNITNNSYGIWLSYSSNNSISGNNITANGAYGIYSVSSSSFNKVFENNFVANEVGILLVGEHNMIFHNNFINNVMQAQPTYMGFHNAWDNGYPSGGNYWSDYDGIDHFRGPYQNETGSDAIGDTSYVYAYARMYLTDRYPLMLPFVYLSGDVNHDHKTDILDATIAAASFGSVPGNSRWNPEADINHDNIVDIFDVILLVNNFGKTAL